MSRQDDVFVGFICDCCSYREFFAEIFCYLWVLNGFDRIYVVLSVCISVFSPVRARILKILFIFQVNVA